MAPLLSPGTTASASPGVAAASVRNATKVYGDASTGIRALDDLTLAIPAGRWTAIMGPSGSGKSTLLHCMAGLDTLTSGQATIGDQVLAGLSDEKLAVLRRRRIGFVFQGFNLVPTLTAIENVTLPFLLDGARPDQSWVDELLGMLGLRDRTGHRPSQLSGGQQQRVAVARALVTRPDIVFADEPTGNLDSRSGAEVLGLLRRAADDLGQTVAMVTHDASAAARADAVVFLADGRTVDHMAEPTAEAVLDRMKELS